MAYLVLKAAVSRIIVMIVSKVAAQITGSLGDGTTQVGMSDPSTGRSSGPR